jgi:8-oxo-dGTP diphosphatase
MNNYDPNFISQKNYVLVGQKAIITHKDKILILQRSEKAGAKGFWSIPGGGLEKGEKARESIIREIVEETKLHVSDIFPFDIKSYEEDGDTILIIGYRTTSKSDEITLNWEHTNYKWLDKEEALKEKLTKDAKFFIKSFNNLY